VWLGDQSQHPGEHCHTLAEMQAWSAENRVEYSRTCPTAVLGEEPEGFVRAGQLDRIRALGREGGRFFTVGQVGAAFDFAKLQGTP